MRVGLLPAGRHGALTVAGGGGGGDWRPARNWLLTVAGRRRNLTCHTQPQVVVSSAGQSYGKQNISSIVDVGIYVILRNDRLTER